jgi:hemin uptake protein HemP
MHTITTTQPLAAGSLPVASARLNGASRTGVPVRRLTSEEVLDGEKEVIIKHGDSEYRLRLTSLNKLILTK